MASLWFGGFMYENDVTPTLVFVGGTTHETGLLRIFNADFTLRTEISYSLNENEWLRYTNITPHTTYSYKVKADTDTDWSSLKFCCTYTYDERVSCGYPMCVALVDITNTTATIQFLKGSNAYYTYVTLEPTSYSGAYRYGETAGETCVIENLDPATEYYGVIQSKSIDGKTNSVSDYTPTFTTYGGANGGVSTFFGFPIRKGQPLEVYEQNGVTYCIVVNALLWNNFTRAINKYLVYKGYPTHTFQEVVSGQSFSASVYNEAIEALKPVGATDANKVISGSPITAEHFRVLERLMGYNYII